MAKGHRTRQTRSTRGSRRRSSSGDPAVDAVMELSQALVDETRRRFPWPADAARRYGLASPYLAVVNARGPWGVWRHERANPPFIPLCLDLMGKAFWRQADNGQRVFAVTCWLRAAQEDDWGIVWGDPVRLCHHWGLDPATFDAQLDWMIGAGLAVYLTPAEAEAVRAWRPVRARDKQRVLDAEQREGGNTRGGEQAESSQAEQVKQSKTSQGAADSQTSSRAHAEQIPDSGQGQDKQSKAEQADQAQHSTAEQTTAEDSRAQESTGQQSTAQDRPQGQRQGTEPENLPESDREGGPGHPRTPGGVRGPKHQARPPAARARARSMGDGARDAEPLGDVIGWANPMAVEFGRRMYEAIRGHSPPADLTTAPEAVRGDVGVWVHYWQRQVEPLIDPGRRAEFAERCYRDVAKKRKVRGIRNLGRVAMARIVPGVLAAMRDDRG